VPDALDIEAALPPWQPPWHLAPQRRRIAITLEAHGGATTSTRRDVPTTAAAATSLADAHVLHVVDPQRMPIKVVAALTVVAGRVELALGVPPRLKYHQRLSTILGAAHKISSKPRAPPRPPSGAKPNPMPNPPSPGARPPNETPGPRTRRMSSFAPQAVPEGDGTAMPAHGGRPKRVGHLGLAYGLPLPDPQPARAGGTKRHRQHASTNSKAGFHARVLPLAAWLSANTGGRAGWSCDPSPDTDPIPNPNPNDPNPNPNPRAGWSCDSGEG